MKTQLSTLYRYNCWANGRLLDLTEQVTLDQFEAPTGYSHTSLHATLFHMLRTEIVWRCLCQQGRLTAPPARLDGFPTVAALRAGWEAEAERMLAFLDGPSDDELNGSVAVTDRQGNTENLIMWHMLMHAYLHSAQHRSEAAALLTQYGQSPADLDFIFYVGQA